MSKKMTKNLSTYQRRIILIILFLKKEKKKINDNVISFITQDFSLHLQTKRKEQRK